MPSISFRLAILALTSLFVTVLGQNANQILNPNLRCYNCESERTRACDDPVDVSVVQLIDCSSMVGFSPSRQDDSRSFVDKVLDKPVDGKFRGGPLIEKAFEEGAQRSPKMYKYVCLKAKLTSGDLQANARTCAKVPSDVKDSCDFIRQEIDGKVKVGSCYACDTDKCNPASLTVASGITIMSSVFFVIFRIIA